MIRTFVKKYNLYLLAALGSVLMTLLMALYMQPIDPDGFIYLKTAQIFSAHGLSVAMHAYNWPFYSILISWVHTIFHISYLNAAGVLNIVLDTVAVVAFLALVKELGGSKRTQVIAILVILFFAYLNHLRNDVLRDHGYYAFGLLAILFLMKYGQSFKWKHAIGWGICIILAALFRIEGAILILFLPLILFFKPGLKFKQRIWVMIKVYAVAGLAVCGWALFHGHTGQGKIIGVTREFQDGLNTIVHYWPIKKAVISEHIFTMSSSSRHSSSLFLTGGLIALFIAVIAYTLGFLYTVLFGYAVKQKIIKTAWSKKAVLYWAMVVNAAIAVIFMLQRFFLVNRYVGLLCFLMLLFMPFVLDKLYSNWRNKVPSLTGSRWFFPLVIVAWLIVAISSVGYFGTSKAYLVKAGFWIKHNTAQNIKLYTNEQQFSFYTDRNVVVDQNDSDLYKQNLKQYDYLVFSVSRHDAVAEARLFKFANRKPIKEFVNNRGDKIFIFKLK